MLVMALRMGSTSQGSDTFIHSVQPNGGKEKRAEGERAVRGREESHLLSGSSWRRLEMSAFHPLLYLQVGIYKVEHWNRA